MWSTGDIHPLCGTHSTTGQNHAAHADRFVTAQQCQHHQHMLPFFCSQPWHQWHPKARNMIKQAFWKDMKLVSQALSAFLHIAYFFNWMNQNIQHLWALGRIQITVIYFHHYWKKSVTGPELFMSGSRSWSYWWNCLPRTLCRVARICPLSRTERQKTVTKVGGRTQIN